MEKLNSESLMIGDWVMYNPNVFIEDEYEPTKEWYPRQINSGDDIDLAIDGCYAPVPLTKEILKKNGFGSVIEGVYNAWEIETYSNQNLRISLSHVESEYNPTQLVVCMGYEPQERVVLRMMPCQYVHELQHALRMCGITKEIEL